MADVDGETPWAVEGADWWRYVDVNRQVVRRDCCVAPETNPLSLPLIAGAVQGAGPFHVSCWEFPPRRVQLRVVVIDQCQSGAAQEDRLVGGWGWFGGKVPGVVWGFRYHPWNFVCLAELFQSVLAVLCPLLFCRWGMPAGLGGTRAAWRSGDASDGCKLANRIGRWVQWQPGGCLADRLHMLGALLPLLFLLVVL